METPGMLTDLIIVLLVLSATITLADDRKCYSPAGTDINAGRPVTIYEPCSNDTDAVSMCCATGGTGNDRCNPNGILGLCYNYIFDDYWRESCTDPTWSSPNCIKLFVNNTGYQGASRPQYNPDGSPITDVRVTPCPGGGFCNDKDNFACCDAGQAVFINYETGETQPQNPIDTTGTTASMTATWSSSTGISSSIAFGANSASSPSSSASIQKSSSSALSGGAIAGIVVGVVLGLALLFLAVCFFGRRRKTRKSNALRHVQSGSESLEKLGIQKQAYNIQEMRGTTDQPRHELPGQHISEAASRERVEM